MDHPEDQVFLCESFCRKIGNFHHLTACIRIDVADGEIGVECVSAAVEENREVGSIVARDTEDITYLIAGIHKIVVMHHVDAVVVEVTAEVACIFLDRVDLLAVWISAELAVFPGTLIVVTEIIEWMTYKIIERDM